MARGKRKPISLVRFNALQNLRRPSCMTSNDGRWVQTVVLGRNEILVIHGVRFEGVTAADTVVYINPPNKPIELDDDQAAIIVQTGTLIEQQDSD